MSSLVSVGYFDMALGQSFTMSHAFKPGWVLVVELAIKLNVKNFFTIAIAVFAMGCVTKLLCSVAGSFLCGLGRGHGACACSSCRVVGASRGRWDCGVSMMDVAIVLLSFWVCRARTLWLRDFIVFAERHDSRLPQLAYELFSRQSRYSSFAADECSFSLRACSCLRSRGRALLYGS